MQTFTRPTLPEGMDIINLAPEDSKQNVLEPTTPVHCLNRGTHELRDKFDGRDYVLPTGVIFTLPYGAALHFKTRQIVPGTRDPNGQGDAAKSYIAIFGVDRPEDCVPFTAAEQERADNAPEGLDREQMISPADRAAAPRGLRNSSAGRGMQGVRPQVDASQQGSSEAAERASGVFVPPTTSAAETDERAADERPMARAGRKVREE